MNTAFNRHLYRTILLNMTGILIVAISGLLLIISGTGIIAGIILIGCAFMLTAQAAEHLNSFNTKLLTFLTAIEDNDNMVYFPENTGDQVQRQLSRSFNRIISLLNKSKTEYLSQEHFYRELIEEIPDGLIACGPTGNIILANTAALRLLGSELLSHQSQAERLLEKAKGQLSVSRRQIRICGDRICILSVKDIKEDLDNKESESWNSLSNILTHEIMNTIAPIVSLSQTLSSYPDSSEKTCRGLNIIKEQSEKLLEFTDSFRHLSHLPPPSIESFPLTAFLHNLRTLIDADLKSSNIAMRLALHTDDIYVQGDEGQLSQVFLNILKNSIQALSDTRDGKIEIRMATETDSYDIQGGHRIQIYITDNGPGIAGDLQDKIFIPFFTTKKDGTGIGLSLCRQIIHNHNGNMTLYESHPGKTVFRITLPCS